MAYADDLIAKFKEESTEDTPAVQQEQPQEQPEDTKGTEDTPQPETAPEGPETQKTDTPSEDKPEDKPEEKPEPKPEDKPEPKPEDKPETKPDLSTLTKEQKAEHAFKRQLSKQASKYEAIISEMSGKFDKVSAELEEIKKAKAQSEKKPLSRDQFEYDDDYVKALVKQGMDEEMAQRAAKEEQERAEQAKKEAEQAEIAEAQRRVAETFNGNCRAAFSEPHAYAEFEAKLKKGVANGLAEFLDQAPAVRDYIFEQPEGPLVLNEMLTNKESFVRVMSQGANPMAAFVTMHDMAREIRERPPVVQPEEQPKPKSTMPPIGKPGAKQSGSAGDMWNDDEALLKFVREHR